MEREGLADRVVFDYTPYGVRDRGKRSDGVNDLIQESKLHLASKGYLVVLVGPSIKENSDNVADYILGKAGPIPDAIARRYGTSYPLPKPYNKKKATELLIKIKPAIVIGEEPLVPTGFHTIVSGAPKRKDGKPIPVIIGRFHSPLENWDTLSTVIFRIGKMARRPKLNSLGLPNGLTKGPVHTIINSLDGSQAVSNVTKENVKKHYKIDCKVIPNGFEADELFPIGEEIEQWKQDGRKIILAPGRNEPRKGKEYVISAFAKLRQYTDKIKLIIPGGGIDTEKYKEYVKSLGLQQDEDVYFLPPLPRREYIMGLRTADVTVCFATGEEGFGRAPVEAAACCGTLVASKIKGYDEALEGMPFVLLAEPKNVDDLASKMAIGLGISKEARKNQAQPNWDHVRKRFDWEVVSDQQAKFFDDLYNIHGGVDWSKFPSSGTLYEKGLTE